MIDSSKRFAVFYLILLIAFAAIAIRLFDMQIINGEEYSSISGNKLSRNIVEKAPRGNITDRYGKVIVGNKSCYSLSLVKDTTSSADLSITIHSLLKMMDKQNVGFDDTLPIDIKTNEFTFASDDEKRDWFTNSKYKKYISIDMTPSEVVERLAEKVYAVDSSYSYVDKRRVVGVRYELDKRGFSAFSPFVIAEDIPMELVLQVKENKASLPCVELMSSYTRCYYNNGLASHILGRVGKMNEKEYATYGALGYSYNDVVGKQGVEKMAESYLKGVDGVKSGVEDSELSENIIKNVDAIPGNNVVLTLDMDLQKVLEDSLKKRISYIQRNGSAKKGSDANAGAAVVVDVKTGEILACASYPTYDIESFNKNYSDLANDLAKPLWNRALSGTYSPGSTFKPLVAIAALQTGSLKPTEKITDEGVYTFYEDYQPRCWLWSDYHATHGSINVSQAIEVSCNYFFYETGRRVGIDVIDQYGKKFGLGEYTGVGLPEEAKGYIASPESKKTLFKDVNQQGWYGADTLQAAIGQSVHAFTPIQIANYIATIANGGTRYKLNIIKSIRSGVDGSSVFEAQPEVEDTVEISPKNLEAIRVGMKNVVDEGSARAIFSGYPVQIGGKTGTAQVGSQASNNALFAAFAPYDNPEIAICVVLEHGVSGANAGYVAKDLFDEYFHLNDASLSAFNEQNNLD